MVEPGLGETILDLLRQRSDDGMRKCEIRRSLDLNGRDGMAEFRDAFRELLADGIVVRKHRGRYVLAESADLVTGTISVHRRGFGFVTREGAEGAPDVFIPPKGMNTAITGDRVLVALAEEDERGPAGMVRKVLHRRHELVTGRLAEVDGDLCVRPLRRGLPEAVPLQGSPEDADADACEEGDWIVARLCPQTHARDPLRAELVRRLGAGGSVAADLDAIVTEYQLEPPYDEGEAAAAAALAPCETEREDLEHLTVVTIDPQNAKDYDDALSIEPGSRPDTVTVGIHIADVAAYVPTGSAFDASARKRAFTVYLPGRTLPMLPAPLSADKCSLLEGQSRPAHTVFIEVSKSSGEVVASRRARTTIKVSRRLSFDDLQAFLDGTSSRGDWPLRVRQVLQELDAVYRTMRRARTGREQFLELAVPEVRVRYAEDPPRVLGLMRVTPKPAHALVEEFMLAANSVVAQELTEREIPGLFRVHEEPKLADLVDFSRWAGQTLGQAPPQLADRAAVNGFLSGLAGADLHDVVVSSFLSAMRRAVYSAERAPHYGLGKEFYCHFTSPIRRYPDLVVHQELLARDLGAPGRGTGECTELANHCSAAEQNQDEAYYAAVDRLKLRHLQGLMAERGSLVFEGLISRVGADGVVVYLPDVGMYGTADRDRLGPERFRLRRDKPVLVGPRSGKTYKCGDVMFVEVRRADVVKGALHLQPVQPRIPLGG